MAFVKHVLVLVAGEAWRRDNTRDRAVAKTPSMADKVVAEASIPGSDGAALTTTREGAASSENETESATGRTGLVSGERHLKQNTPNCSPREKAKRVLAIFKTFFYLLNLPY